MVQAGSLGLLGFGMNHVAALRAADVVSQSESGGKAKSVIFVFLSGGLTQHDSFDPKPDAPVDIRGEFSPIATQTPGVSICEHLPMLAACSQHWSLIRSLTTPYNEHSQGHTAILTGRTPKVNSANRSPGCKAGRDHWGAVQTVFVAGGGTQGGVVVGSSDKNGAYPASDAQQPENLAATIYHAMGIPRTAVWKDELDRPHTIYHGEPIRGLL